jgi:hypothetical protein
LVGLWCLAPLSTIFQLLATGLWFSPVSSTNKTEHNDATVILLKVALNTINQPIFILKTTKISSEVHTFVFLKKSYHIYEEKFIWCG